MTSQHFFIDGPAGRLEAAAAMPSGECRGIALVAHPHPLYGGTMDNKVVTTLRKSYGPLEVVAGIDLAVKKGECFGLLGPNGAGKTFLPILPGQPA